MGDVGEKALLHFLSNRSDVKAVYLYLDSDTTEDDTCSRLVPLMPKGLTVRRLIPPYKDRNEVRTRWGEITNGKYLREAVYRLEGPP